MNDVKRFAIKTNGVVQLPVPPHITSFDCLYDGLELGVYSALRTFEHHKFLYLEHHIARTVNSMRLLGWDYQLDEARLRLALHDVCTAYPFADARVRFDVLAAPPTHLGTSSRELIALMPLKPIPPVLYETGVNVAVTRDLQRARPLAKTADFAQQRRSYQVGGDIYEYLLIDDDGRLLEGTGTNFYGVRDGVLRTAGEGVLAGIARKIVLEQAARLGIPVSLEAVRLDEIPHLQEAALSGSSRALLSVVQIGEQVVGDGRPGPICRHLLTAYNTFVSQAIRTAIT